jgi:hypothetical protein
MTDTKQHGIEAGFLEGRVIRPRSPAEVAQAVELAFDYRGDVTLELTSGERIEGYVYNRTAEGDSPALQLFPKGAPGERRIPYGAIAAIMFSGKDTASGKSWEAWTAKKESQRRAEAEQAETDARRRGYL